MRLTRRGWTVVGVGALAFFLAVGFGARSLNAVVVPSVVALAAGYVQVRFLRDVTVVRDPPADDYAGRDGVAHLTFQTPGGDGVRRPFVATVRERVGEGIRVVDPAEYGGDDELSTYAVETDETGEYARFETAVGETALAYRVEYLRRGERELGPATVAARDVFGLVEEASEIRGTDSVLVYPRVYRLSPWGRNSLRRLEEFGRSRQREEFEELREYSPGDPLRDIHWKTTAKRDELVVKEFAAEAEAETVTLSAGATIGAADEMAEAVASLAFALLEEEIPVEISTVRSTVEIGPERGGVRRMLRMLALVTAGRVPNPDADVVVHGREGRTTVGVADREFDFGDLVGGDWAAEDVHRAGADPAETRSETGDDDAEPMEATP